MLDRSGRLDHEQANRLRIIEGDLGDMATAVDVLFPEALGGDPVHTIVFGIGGFAT